MALELGVDWQSITGTGNGGRVRERDIHQAATGSKSAASGTSVLVSSRRRAIANRMIASQQQSAPVTLTTRLDATNLVSLRSQFKLAADGAIVPSYSDIVIKLVALVLMKHPLLAAREDGEEWVIPASAADLHIGLAVDTDQGLLVPVIRHAGTLGLFDLASQTVALIEKSRSGRLSFAEMEGGVFTITNLGGYGIDTFTPIINRPETAVLGLGRIRCEPAVVNQQIIARDQITLSLTFDHRIVDGAPAARFLQTVSQAIENASAWLVRGDG